jgi:hypothetical protein
MRILKLALITSTIFSLVFVGSTFAAKKKKPKNTCGATSSQSDGDCPVEGCGGDSLLNRRKNLKTPASHPETYTRSDFVKLKFPASWNSGTSRTLLKKWGEGTAVTYDAFLLKVKNYPSGAESCNCNLTLNENNDFHLVTGHKSTTPEDDSITGEITPRLRPDGWTITKLRKLAKDKAYVRLTGYLMLDTQHVGKSVPARVTHWEIHPVTSFKVCTESVASCKAGNGWQNLSDFPEP